MDLEQFKILLEYSQRSPYAGRLESPDARAEGENPLCGDWLEIQVRLRQGTSVGDGRYLHRGCALSAVAASILLGYARGRNVVEIQKLAPRDYLDILGIPVSSARLSCAFLALEVFKTLV